MKTLNAAQAKKFNGFKTKSAQIRYLNKLGWSRGEIAKKVDRRYQMVRNILEGPTPKNPQEKI